MNCRSVKGCHSQKIQLRQSTKRLSRQGLDWYVDVACVALRCDLLVVDHQPLVVGNLVLMIQAECGQLQGKGLPVEALLCIVVVCASMVLLGFTSFRSCCLI